MEIFFGLLPLLLPLLLLVVGGLIGKARERSHLADLDQRERSTSPLLTVDVKALPGGVRVHAGGHMVMGNVVIASDYFKTLAAALRNLVGGELRSLTPLMERGRREARLRMLDEAQRLGADLVINVRFETSTITPTAAEVICYGTALRRAT